MKGIQYLWKDDQTPNQILQINNYSVGLPEGPMVFQSVVLFLLMSLLIFSSTITTAIAALPKQQELDRISALPGQPPVTFSQFSGYVTVNEQPGRALFYWLTEATTFPEKKPLVLWFNGEANLLFLESPAGVGFSYTNTRSDLNDSGDKRTGHFVPQLAEKIVEYNKALLQPILNLKGFIVGNAVFDNYYDEIGTIEYWWSHSMISDTRYRSVLKNCNFKVVESEISQPCKQAKYHAITELGNIDQYSIYTPTCLASHDNTMSPIRFKNTLLRRRLSEYDPCSANYAENGVLGIGQGKIWTDSEFSMLPTYKKLFTAGLRIWVFSGDTDAVVPVTATRLSLSHLNLTIKTLWYPWNEDNQVGGWTEVYDQLTFATVRGAGHEVPLFQPKRALILFKSFLAGKELPILPGYENIDY
ncbi:serine carboxypeptidase 24 [Quercus suber]|uniref:Serine carboxypeptidase 24 n=1 Tax=Quercus suber TaxID=58331 RepID=A0AAW0LQY3_QUESU